MIPQRIYVAALQSAANYHESLQLAVSNDRTISYLCMLVPVS